MNEDQKLEKAIKIVNNIANFAVYSYVPNSEDTEFVRQRKPTYFVGDDGRKAIKIVLQALENSIPKKKIEDKVNELKEERNKCDKEEEAEWGKFNSWQ